VKHNGIEREEKERSSPSAGPHTRTAKTGVMGKQWTVQARVTVCVDWPKKIDSLPFSFS
jgi:hypothetical protein